MKYIMSIDQGTTSSRAVIFDRNGEIVSIAQKEFTQYYTGDGYVEHDPEEIFSSQLEVCRKAMEKLGVTAADIAAIGITNQRETTIVWDKNTGKPIYNAIVWQCRRTAPFCENLKEQGLTQFFRSKTGLLIDPYFSATKLRWILDNIEGAKEKAQAGELLFGTVDCYLLWKLSGGKCHATDYSNASRTMLFNIHTLEWDNEILGLLGIPASMMPKVVDSSGVICETDPSLFGEPIVISGCAGDQQAALFGQCCFDKGDVKNTYGTGGFLLMNTGDEPVESKSGLLSTIGWGIGGKVTYALEGSVFIAGAVVKWLRDELMMIENAADTEKLARSVTDTNGVYIVPAFVGLGAPYWDSNARGIITGLTRGANRAHIVRAALEAIAYQTCDVLDAMEKDTGALKTIKADGGASSNGFLMQFQADVLSRTIVRPKNVESTAFGAFLLAGLGCGYYKDKNDVINLGGSFEKFSPSMDESKRAELLDGWHRAVGMALSENN
ncbi:MAG: glycerol kinase GlpK [Ruminococcus sp.]|nr:glycerol kinase GlpK [Ruminococcus sp.]